MNNLELNNLISYLETIDNWEAFQIMLSHPHVMFAGKNSRLISADILSEEKIRTQIHEKLSLLFTSKSIDIPRPSIKSPHVTLARFQRSTPRNIGTYTDKIINNLLGGETVRQDDVQNIELIKSTLTRCGPIYSTLKRINLKNDSF